MKEFYEKINETTGSSRPDLIEKDFHLHRILRYMSTDEYYRENYLIKGGTCLIKAYLDHFRFSEDIDFTWSDQSRWEGMTRSAIRAKCSEEKDLLIAKTVELAGDLGFDFSGDTGDRKEVHIFTGGRMVTLYVGYHSDILNTAQGIKIEVNFQDRLFYPPKRNVLKSIAGGMESRELEFLFKSRYDEYTSEVEFNCYDPREIFIEKCRAMLTRREYKFRDVLDIYFLQKKMGFSIEEFKGQIKQKTHFIIDVNKTRYGACLEEGAFPSEEILDGDELMLLLVPAPDDLEAVALEIHEQVERIRQEMLEERTRRDSTAQNS